MSRDRQIPTNDAVIRSLSERVRKLEAQLSQVIDSRRTPLLFSFAGPLEEDVESPPLRPIHPTQIDLIVPQVLVAPSGDDLIVDLKLNGTVVRTLTVLDGEFYVEDAVPFVVPMGYKLTATVTQASGAESLSIQLIPKLL